MDGPLAMPAGVRGTFGAVWPTWTILVRLRASFISPLMAVMASGVFCTLVSRSSAVTMISSICAVAPPDASITARARQLVLGFPDRVFMCFPFCSLSLHVVLLVAVCQADLSPSIHRHNTGVHIYW